MEADADTARAEQELEARLHYADWWRAQQLQQLCSQQHRLAGLELERIATRHANQELRDSERIWLEQGWRQNLRDCAPARKDAAQARHALNRLVRPELTAAHTAAFEELPNRIPDVEQWANVIQAHPDVRKQRLIWLSRQQYDDRWYDDIDARVSVSQQLDRRSDISGTGTGLVAAFSFEVPLGSLSTRRETAATQKSAARYRWLDAQESIMRELNQALETYRDEYQNLELARERVELAEVRLQEQRQRQSIEAEEGFVRLRNLTLELARSEQALILAQHGAWQALAPLKVFDRLQPDHSEQRILASPPTLHTGDQGPNWSKAVYVWDSKELLDQRSRDRVLDNLKDSGFDAIYLGVSAAQLEDNHLVTALTQTITAAEQHGIKTDLLLGEPLWLTDDHRANLGRLITSLADVPFRRLHLDLEVEQLAWPVPDTLLRGWADTIDLAVEASPWPVSLVAHHRWFTDPNTAKTVCVPCQLPEFGIHDVSVMIYSTNTDRVGQLASTAIELWPDLTFTVVQSVEAELPDTNSWHGQSRSRLASLEGQWQASWRGIGVAGVAWQAWRYYPGNDQRGME